jgi:hypothetical protein
MCVFTSLYVYMYAHIFGLFSDAVSVPPNERKDDRWIVNWRYILSFFGVAEENHGNQPVCVAGLRAEIWTPGPPNTKQEC